MPAARPFLTAEWRNLLMLNYEVDPAVLAPLVPAGTELDLWEGKTLVSMVGFLFQRTRVLGAAVPFHTHFEEVNLRFYVRRAAPDGSTRRGVVFIKEIVPRAWIARVANWVYREHYIALRMGHTVEQQGGQLCPGGLVEYTWRYKGRLHRLGALVAGEPENDPHGTPQPLQPGSEEEFITEHYWGYTRQGKRASGEYRVEHAPWRVWQVTQPYLLSDVKSLYGAAFEPFLRRRPRSAFLAEGSPVAVYLGERIRL